MSQTITNEEIMGVGMSTEDGCEIFNDYENNIATGYFTHAEGENTEAAGRASHAEGKDTKASGIGAHAEGWGSEALAGDKGTVLLSPFS